MTNTTTAARQLDQEAARLLLLDFHGVDDDTLDRLALEQEYQWEMRQGHCMICDGLGHGYPGGRPCPLEQADYSGEPPWAL